MSKSHQSKKNPLSFEDYNFTCVNKHKDESLISFHILYRKKKVT
jgi:hypothetical protein